MKYVLFSDIHGNIYALEAMLEDLRNESIEGYLFCGDLVGYYYHARAILEVFRQLPNFHAVRGNHDELFLDALADDSVRHEAIKKYGSSYSNLDIEVANYIRTLPEILSFRLGNFYIAMVHGSLKSPLWGRIYPDSELDIIPSEYDFLFVGHTHYQMTRINENNCTIVNPGSLGQPRDGKGFTYYIVDFATGEVVHKLIEFDKSVLLKEIKERDPGIDYLSKVLKRCKGA